MSSKRASPSCEIARTFSASLFAPTARALRTWGELGPLLASSQSADHWTFVFSSPASRISGSRTVPVGTQSGTRSRIDRSSFRRASMYSRT